MRNMNRPTALISGLTAALTLSACTAPSTSDKPEQPAPISIDCPASPGQSTGFTGSPGNNTFEFSTTEPDGSTRVIGRLSMRFEAAGPGEAVPKVYEKDWSFPTDDERLYSYGIPDLPNIHTKSGVYELSAEENLGSDTEYELHCDHRTEPWPAPDLKELEEPNVTTSPS